MNDKLFLIAAGGTGMRCLESFIHLCAMGLLDGKEINILSIDTDQGNGNKTRTRDLIQTYNNIKGKNGTTNKDTFFSAKIIFYDYYTDYDNNKSGSFIAISKTEKRADSENKMLADLFMENSVQEFNLMHGYRAQTHLGSYLMYHAFIETAKKAKASIDIKPWEQDLDDFCTKIQNTGEGGRVFIFGSLFGGTGASSLPVIPKAIEDYINVRSNGQAGLSDNIKFGATLLTDYFKFNPPTEKQKSTIQNAVIADSGFFRLNSQASLQYYQNDPTIKKRFKKMYHIGWPIDPIDFSDDKEKEVETGGRNQKNSCHIVELISATAVYDFFNQEEIDNNEVSFLYKTFEVNDNKLNISFNDLIGDEEEGKKFARKFTAMVQLMHLTLSKMGGALGRNGVKAIINSIEQDNIREYSDIEDVYTNYLNDYFKEYFGYSINLNKNFEKKWLYQIYDSLQGGNFILKDMTFTKNPKEIKKVSDELGELWPDGEYNWNTSLFKGSDKLFTDKFKDFDEVSSKNQFENQQVSLTTEKFLAHLYNTFNTLNNI